MKIILLLTSIFGLAQSQVLPLEAMSKAVQTSENAFKTNFSSKKAEIEDNDFQTQDRGGILEDIPKTVQGKSYYQLNGLYLSRNKDEYDARKDLLGGRVDRTQSITGAGKDQWYYNFIEKDLDVDFGDPVKKEAFLETSSMVQVNFDYYFNLWNTKMKWTNKGGKHPSSINNTGSFELRGKNETHHLAMDHDSSHAFNESVEFSVGEKWDGNHLYLSLVFGCWLHWDDKSKIYHTALVQVSSVTYSFSSGKYLPSISGKVPTGISFITNGIGSWNIPLKGVFDQARKLAKNPNEIFNLVVITELAFVSEYIVFNYLITDLLNYFALVTSAIAQDLTDVANGESLANGTLKLVIDSDDTFWFEYSNASSGRSGSSNIMYSENMSLLHLLWSGFGTFFYFHYNIV